MSNARIVNNSEVGFGNFKVVAEVIGQYAYDNGLTSRETLQLANLIGNALDQVTQDNQVCFDSDAFVDVAVGN